MTAPERISVVIPTYNRAQMVVEAVECVLAQTHSNTEIIVVDDGGTDDTPQRLAEFGPRLVYMRQANQGVAAARNAGISRATGEFVAFLDSDDLWHQRKLEIQMAFLRRHPEVGLVVSHWDLAPGTLERCAMPLGDVSRIDVERVSCAQLAVRASFGTSGVLVRKSCLDAVGPFDATLRTAEDRDMWIRIASRFEICWQNIGLCLDRRGVGRLRVKSPTGQDDHLSNSVVHTEANTARMLDKVFRELAPLRGRWLLERRARCVATYEAGMLYGRSGQHAQALGRLLRTFLLWPLPVPAGMPPRAKSLILWPLRWLGLKLGASEPR